MSGFTSFSSQPTAGAYVSSRRPIIYEATSAHSDVIYCKVTVKRASGATTITSSHIEYPVAGTSAQFRFNAQNYIKPYTGYVFGNVDGGQDINGVEDTCEVTFTDYITTSGTPAANTSISSDRCTVANIGIQHEDTQSLDNYIADDSSALWLTDKPDYSNIRLDESEYLYIISPTTSTPNRLYFATYDSAGSLLKSGYYSISRENMIGVGLGPANLNAATVTFTNGSGTPIESDVKHYKVIMNLTGAAKSSDHFFNLDTTTKQHNTRLHFSNRLGGIDSFTFQHEQGREFRVKQQMYDTPQTNSDMSWDVEERQAGTLVKESVNTYSLKSGILSEQEVIWLEQLKDSEDGRIQSGSNYIPILISDFNRHTVKDSRRLKSFRCELKYRYSHAII